MSEWPREAGGNGLQHLCLCRSCNDGCGDVELIQRCLARQALQGTAARPHLVQAQHRTQVNTLAIPSPLPLQMDTPNADVHGGFVLRLVWRRSGKADVDVASTTSADGVNLYISRDDATNVNAPSDGKWTVRTRLSCPAIPHPLLQLPATVPPASLCMPVLQPPLAPVAAAH